MIHEKSRDNKDQLQISKNASMTLAKTKKSELKIFKTRYSFFFIQ